MDHNPLGDTYSYIDALHWNHFGFLLLLSQDCKEESCHKLTCMWALDPSKKFWHDRFQEYQREMFYHRDKKTQVKASQGIHSMHLGDTFLRSDGYHSQELVDICLYMKNILTSYL